MRLPRNRMAAMALLASAAVVPLLSTVAFANVYPSGVRVDPAGFDGTCGTVKISYILNEDADGTSTLPGVKIEVLNAADTVVRTVMIPRQARGRHAYIWDGRDDAGNAVPNASGPFKARVTAADFGYTGGWAQLSDNTELPCKFYVPVGVDVNKNVDSPYYGRIYVSEGRGGPTATVVRTTTDGIYALEADRTDAIGQGDTARTGGVAWITGTGDTATAWGASSPFKLTVGSDDNVYVADYSDSHSGIWRFDPDLDTAIEVLDNTGRAASGLNATHGSISSIWLEGAGSSLSMVTVDEDWISNAGTIGYMLRYNIGAGTLPFVGISNREVKRTVVNTLVDVARDSTGRWYWTQYRLTTGSTSFTSFMGNPATDSASEPGAATSVIGTSTEALGYSAVAVDDARGRIACASNGYSKIAIRSMSAPGTVVAEIPTGTRSRDVAFDAAGNVYFVNSSVERLMVYSPPDGPNSMSTTSAAFSSGGKSNGAPLITQQPVSATADGSPGNASFTVVASGTGLSYQWLRDGAPLSDGGIISGSSTPTLTITGATREADDGAVFAVRVCNATGVQVSNPVVLSVGVTFVQHPLAMVVCVNGSGALSVQAQGAGTLSYQWQKYNTTAAAWENVVNGGTFSGATTATLQFTGAVAGDAGSYRCQVTDSAFPSLQFNSNTAVVTVRSGPTVVSNSGAKTVAQGGQASFQISMSGTGTLTYYWYWRVGAAETLITSGVNRDFIWFQNVPCEANGATIVCRVTDNCGTTESTTTITVTPSNEVCTDGIDNDCDGLIDCADDSCNTNPGCVVPCNDPFADADNDGDVDMDDFAAFQVCFTGPSGDGYDRENCHCFDRNGNNAVDQGVDLADFMACGSGAAVPADPACDNYPSGDVVINEVQYDEWTTADVSDSREFVELYNRSAEPVDIAGWKLRSPTMAGRDVLVPGTPGGGSVVIPAYGYYVIGSVSVPNAILLLNPATDYWENDREALELVDANGTVKDTVVYERYVGPVAGLAAPEGGIWGPFVSTSFAMQSLSRWVDGLDTGSNGRDFGLRVATPGASNNSPVISAFVPQDVDALSAGADVSGLTGSFVHARVISPGDVTTMVGADDLNPNAIPASPQGGNAIIAWDPSGGGNAVVSDGVMTGDGSYDLWVYLDTSDITIAGAETTAYGLMGSVDPLFNTPDPGGTLFAATTNNLSGCTGLAWIFQKDNAGNVKRLFLVDAGAGGNSTPDVTPMDWVVHQAIDMSAVASGWYRLSISYTGATGAVVAKFGAQTFNFNTAAGLKGGFYVGYRESLAATPASLRPPTFDKVQ